MCTHRLRAHAHRLHGQHVGRGRPVGGGVVHGRHRARAVLLDQSGVVPVQARTARHGLDTTDSSHIPTPGMLRLTLSVKRGLCYIHIYIHICTFHNQYSWLTIYMVNNI